MKTITCVDCQKVVQTSCHTNHQTRCPECQAIRRRTLAKRWKVSLNGRNCDCGNKAVTRFAGEWCCQRCHDLDFNRLRAEAELKKARQERERQWIKGDSWRTVWDEANAWCGE